MMVYSFQKHIVEVVLWHVFASVGHFITDLRCKMGWASFTLNPSRVLKLACKDCQLFWR